MAALPITAQVPLFADPHGTLRIEGARVTLDSIVTAFRAGATAEEIAGPHVRPAYRAQVREGSSVAP
jgi:Protein of unknown function (DUF433)